jgi:hypothetical protein
MKLDICKESYAKRDTAVVAGQGAPFAAGVGFAF